MLSTNTESGQYVLSLYGHKATSVGVDLKTYLLSVALHDSS